MENNITLFCAFAGRFFCLEPILNGINDLDYPKEKLDLVMIDASSNPEFHIKLLEWVKDKPYNSIKVIKYSIKPVLGTEELFGNRNKMRNISRMYQDNKKYITNDLVFYIEDDVEVAPQSIKKLLPLLDDPLVVMATGRVLSRFAKTVDGKVLSQAMIYDEKEKTWLFFEAKEEGIEQAEVSTWGCSLAKNKFIQEICLFNGIYFDWGQDAIFGREMTKRGYKILIDHSIHCPHYDYTGRIY